MSEVWKGFSFDVGMIAGVGQSLLNIMDITFSIKYCFQFMDVYKEMEDIKSKSFI